MKYLIYLSYLIVGVIVVLGIRYIQVQNRISFVPQKSTVKLEPPAQALTGVLSQTEGKVEHLLRGNDEYQVATPGGIIYQGESISTGVDSSAVVLFGQYFTLHIYSEASVNLANLVPPNVLIHQRTGTVDYQVELETAPVSVRTQHVLFEIEPGNTVISVEGTTIIATAFSGSVKIGIVDLENNTHVYALSAEQRVVIDDENRTVAIE